MAPKTSRRIFEFRLILACLAAASTLYAQSPDADPQVVVDSMLEARARLQSGHFRAVGTVEQVLLDHEVSDVLPSEIEGIFDHHRGLVRYETRGEYRSIISSSENLTPEVIEQLRSRL